MNNKTSESHYATQLAAIMDLMTNHQFKAALELIKEELKMPYVPWDYEQKFEKLQREIEAELAFIQPTKALTADEVLTLLFASDLASIAIGVTQLGKLNLHAIANDLKRFVELADSKLAYHQAIVIELLIAQKVAIDLIVNSGKKLNPAESLSVFDHVEVQRVYKQLQTHFFKQPSKLQTALSELNHYLLLTYHQSLDANNTLADDLAQIVEFYFDATTLLNATQSALLERLRADYAL